MYCRKCGKKLAEDSQFCSACGTKVIVEETEVEETGKVDPIPYPPEQNEQLDTAADQTEAQEGSFLSENPDHSNEDMEKKPEIDLEKDQSKQSFQGVGVDPAKLQEAGTEIKHHLSRLKSRDYLMIGGILMFVSAIFMCSPIYSISMLGMSRGMNIFDIYSGVGFIPVCIMLLTLAAGVLSFIPYFLKKYDNAKYFSIFGVVVAVLDLMALIAAILIVNASLGEIGAIVSAGLSFAGWLMILVLLVAIVCYILMFIKDSESSELPPVPEQESLDIYPAEAEQNEEQQVADDTAYEEEIIDQPLPTEVIEEPAANEVIAEETVVEDTETAEQEKKELPAVEEADEYPAVIESEEVLVIDHPEDDSKTDKE